MSRFSVTVMLVLMFSFAHVFTCFSQDLRLLIARPNNYDYTVDDKSLWVPAITEAYFYFRFSGFDNVTVIDASKITDKLSGYRDFRKRVAKSKYMSVAKSLNATHLLYSEYECKDGKNANVHLSLIPLDKSQKEGSSQATISHELANDAFTEALKELVTSVGFSTADIPADFLGINPLGSEGKNIKNLGTLLSQDGKLRFDEIAIGCKKIFDEDRGMLVPLLIGSKFYAKAEKMEDALVLGRSLISSLGNKAPRLHLQIAAIYRMIGKYAEANSIIDRFKMVKGINSALLMEKGLIFLALGNNIVALKNFKELSEIDPTNPDVFLNMANAALALNMENEADEYIKKVADITGKSKGEIYCQIGISLSKTKNLDKAIKMLSKATAIMPDNVNAWLLYGDLQIKAKNDSIAAECFSQLYYLDYIKYHDYLNKAGEIFIKKGLFMNAHKLYSDAYEKEHNPQIAISLAELELKQDNCARIRELLGTLSSPWDKDPKVLTLLDGCMRDINKPVLTLNGINPVTLIVGHDAYVEAGALANDIEDGDLTQKIKISGKVNHKLIGTYIVTYKVTDAGNNSTIKTRRVTVVDNQPPVIMLRGGSPMHLAIGDKFTDPGASASDNRDGNMSDQINMAGQVNTGVIGVYKLTYSVTDASGNESKIQRYVNIHGPNDVIDNVPPTIRLIGGSPTTILQGSSYNEPSVNAADNIDGDITTHVSIEGEVDVNTPGDYTILYMIIDKSGNSAKKVLRVKVKPDMNKSSALNLKTPLSNTQQQDPYFMAKAVKKDIKSPRKPIIAVFSGFGGVGCAVAGFLFDRKAKDEMDEFNKQKDGFVGTESDRDVLLREIEDNGIKYKMLRNVMYGVGSGLGVVFIINIAIPSK